MLANSLRVVSAKRGNPPLRVYCWEKSQPAKFDKTDYQTIPIILYFTLFLFIYFMATQKILSPDPIVGLGARLDLVKVSSMDFGRVLFQ